MSATTSVVRGQSRAKSLEQMVKTMQSSRLLVGIPQSSDPRPVQPGEKAPPTNALIGYLMETGVPDKNIPARPFLVPGVRAAQGQVTAYMATALKAAVSGLVTGASPDTAVQQALDRAGAACVSSVKKTIVAGVPPPLSQRTLQARARRKNKQTGKLVQTAVAKGARKELSRRSAGESPSVEFAKPLYDTRSLFNSVQYVVQVKGS